eukprot:1159509-Pelagomonas_calceolata.AAC.1
MSSNAPSLTQHLQVIKGFSEKADGKDKLTALIQPMLQASSSFQDSPSPDQFSRFLLTILQYVCMFLSANEPGNIKKVQASVTAARKVFRIMRVSRAVNVLVKTCHAQVPLVFPFDAVPPLSLKYAATKLPLMHKFCGLHVSRNELCQSHAPACIHPCPSLSVQPLETMTPLLVNPRFNNVDPKQAPVFFSTSTHKSMILPSLALVHVPFELLLCTGQVSVSAWALGSVCTIISESWQIARLSVTRKEVRIILLKLIAEAESDKTSASSEILAIALLSQIVLSILDMQNEPDEKYEARVEEARKAINQRMLVLVHGIFQLRLRTD